MGKVQEALSKIQNHAKPTAVLAARLRIPAQHERQDSTLPTEASLVKQWIIAQDAANSSAGRSDSLSSAKTLLRALQHSNRSICTPSVRMLIMDEYEKPFIRTMQTLDTRYLYLDFPIQADAEKTFHLAATLCQEMAYGYKIAIVDSLKPRSRNEKHNPVKNIISRKSDKKNRNQSIRSAFRYLAHLALRYSQINRDWPDDIWRDLNAMAAIASHDRTIDQTDPLVIGTDELPAIRQQYASLCALHLLDQNQLTADNVRSLFAKLTRYASLIDFHKGADVTDKPPTMPPTVIYSVGLDGPPVPDEFRLNQSDETRRYFSINALLEKLVSENEDEATGIAYSRLQRMHSRAPRAATITVEAGLQKICEQIKLTPPVENTVSQYTNIQQLLTTQEHNSSAIQNQNTQVCLLNQTDTPLCSHLFEVENESAGGFCLRWTGTEPCNLQIGELLSHCYRNESYQNQGYKSTDTKISWHLSIVRWLRTEADGTLRMGVESVSRHAKSIDVLLRWNKPRHSSKSTAEGLLINYQPTDSKARMLILPMNNYKTGETIAYRDDNNLHFVKLIESVNLTGNYQCFATLEVAAKSLTETNDYTHEYQVAV